MAISRPMRAVLRALSYSDIEVRKYYKLVRWFHSLTFPSLLRPLHSVWDHQVCVEDHCVPVRIYRPRRKGQFPLLIFFHGGGWVTGTIQSYDRICRTMAAFTNHIVVSVDYRLAPEHRFPAGLMDCYHVTQELMAHGDTLGISPKDITLIGDSAGGNLAAAISLMARDRGDPAPARQILLYPACAYDHTESSPYPSVHKFAKGYLLTSKNVQEYMDLYRSCDEDITNPYFAPLCAANFSRQPSTLIITAGCDPLRDEGEAYGRQLRQAGNHVWIRRMPNALHGFLSLGEHYRHVRDSYRIINEFLKGE